MNMITTVGGMTQYPYSYQLSEFDLCFGAINFSVIHLLEKDQNFNVEYLDDIQ